MHYHRYVWNSVSFMCSILFVVCTAVCQSRVQKKIIINVYPLSIYTFMMESKWFSRSNIADFLRFLWMATEFPAYIHFSFSTHYTFIHHTWIWVRWFDSCLSITRIEYSEQHVVCNVLLHIYISCTQVYIFQRDALLCFHISAVHST